VGAECPLCGQRGCYREITAYWRYAIELFPHFDKQRIPVARFLCGKVAGTFSLLPVQLIRYHQYTAGAVLGALVLALSCWQSGGKGFYGAAEAVDPDSLLTAYLVACWLAMVVRGFRRVHGALSRFYDLSGVGGARRSHPCWVEFNGYLHALGWKPEVRWGPWVMGLLSGYSRMHGQFLFGTPSQHRIRVRSG
jgi:hypothetical protein